MLEKFWIILRNIWEIAVVWVLYGNALQYFLCMFVFVDQVLGLQAQASKND